MSEAPPSPASGSENVQSRSRLVLLAVEVTAGVVLLGTALWLFRNHEPRTLIGAALLNPIVWVLVLVVSAFGTAGSLVPFHLGQGGTEIIFQRYPQLKGQPWQRLESAFQRRGAPTLIISGIPFLGTALLLAAGAFGIGRGEFLRWVFASKVLRYWVLAFIAIFGLQLLT